MKPVKIPDGPRSVATAVLFNVALALAHGWTHAAIPVAVPDWQYAVAVVTTALAPLVGVALLASGRRATGLWAVALAAAGALAFEGVAHFGASNPDHVSTVESGRTLFAATAGLSVLGDAVVLVVAGAALRSRFRRVPGEAAGESAQ